MACGAAALAGWDAPEGAEAFGAGALRAHHALEAAASGGSSPKGARRVFDASEASASSAKALGRPRGPRQLTAAERERMQAIRAIGRQFVGSRAVARALSYGWADEGRLRGSSSEGEVEKGILEEKERRRSREAAGRRRESREAAEERRESREAAEKEGEGREAAKRRSFEEKEDSREAAEARKGGSKGVISGGSERDRSSSQEKRKGKRVAQGKEPERGSSLGSSDSSPSSSPSGEPCSNVSLEDNVYKKVARPLCKHSSVAKQKRSRSSKTKSCNDANPSSTASMTKKELKNSSESSDNSSDSHKSDVVLYGWSVKDLKDFVEKAMRKKDRKEDGEELDALPFDSEGEVEVAYAKELNDRQTSSSSVFGKRQKTVKSAKTKKSEASAATPLDLVMTAVQKSEELKGD